MDGMRHMEKKGGFRFEEIRVGGGGAQSSEICQITADMFGLPVVRTQTYEVSGDRQCDFCICDAGRV